MSSANTYNKEILRNIVKVKTETYFQIILLYEYNTLLYTKVGRFV